MSAYMNELPGAGLDVEPVCACPCPCPCECSCPCTDVGIFTPYETPYYGHVGTDAIPSLGNLHDAIKIMG